MTTRRTFCPSPRVLPIVVNVVGGLAFPMRKEPLVDLLKQRIPWASDETLLRHLRYAANRRLIQRKTVGPRNRVGYCASKREKTKRAKTGRGTS